MKGLRLCQSDAEKITFNLYLTPLANYNQITTSMSLVEYHPEVKPVNSPSSDQITSLDFQSLKRYETHIQCIVQFKRKITFYSFFSFYFFYFLHVSLLIFRYFYRQSISKATGIFKISSHAKIMWHITYCFEILRALETLLQLLTHFLFIFPFSMRYLTCHKFSFSSSKPACYPFFSTCLSFEKVAMKLSFRHQLFQWLITELNLKQNWLRSEAYSKNVEIKAFNSQFCLGLKESRPSTNIYILATLQNDTKYFLQNYQILEPKLRLRNYFLNQFLVKSLLWLNIIGNLKILV